MAPLPEPLASGGGRTRPWLKRGPRRPHCFSEPPPTYSYESAQSRQPASVDITVDITVTVARSSPAILKYIHSVMLSMAFACSPAPCPCMPAPCPACLLPRLCSLACLPALCPQVSPANTIVHRVADDCVRVVINDEKVGERACGRARSPPRRRAPSAHVCSHAYPHACPHAHVRT